MKLFISFAVLLLLLLAVPLVIAFVYKHFYNRHGNRVAAQGMEPAVQGSENSVPAASARRAGKWLSPIAVFFLALAAEILALVLISVICMGKFYNSEEYQLDSYIYSMTESDASDDYGTFDGSAAEGYSLLEKNSRDFTCQIYEKTDDREGTPLYVVHVTYTGSETVGSWDSELYVGARGIGTMGDFNDDETSLYVIISDELDSGDGIELTVCLFSGALNDYSANAMGTYDMPDPTETFTVTIR